MKRILLICAFLLALAVQAGAQSKQQQQQPVEVNGLVVDSDDVPIVGATVYIKDEPGIGSITNSEGRFKLTAKLYNTLAVSFMGYETAEQIITSSRSPAGKATRWKRSSSSVWVRSAKSA